MYGDGMPPARPVKHREAIETLIRNLDALGFRWEGRKRARDDEFIDQLKKYAAEQDESVSPAVSYVAPDGYRLGQKVANLRARHSSRHQGRGHILGPGRED